MKAKRRTFIGGASAAALLSGSGVAFAQKKYDEGASDTEIKIGHCGPYSGPASAYGVIGKSHQAFFKAVNDAGGVNGRKINFITLDDGYSPPKAVEDVRQLVEQDKVLLLFQTLGTPSNTAIHKYVNQKKIPHLFISTGASKWGDPRSTSRGRWAFNRVCRPRPRRRSPLRRRPARCGGGSPSPRRR